VSDPLEARLVLTRLVSFIAVDVTKTDEDAKDYQTTQQQVAVAPTTASLPTSKTTQQQVAGATNGGGARGIAATGAGGAGGRVLEQGAGLGGGGPNRLDKMMLKKTRVEQRSALVGKVRKGSGSRALVSSSSRMVLASSKAANSVIPSYLIPKRTTNSRQHSTARARARLLGASGGPNGREAMGVQKRRVLAVRGRRAGGGGGAGGRGGEKTGGKVLKAWPASARELQAGVNDSWNAYQAAHTGRQCLPSEWKAARQVEGRGFRVQVEGRGFKVQVEGRGFKVQVEGSAFGVRARVQPKHLCSKFCIAAGCEAG
jgi:hypothetical protein